MIVEVWSPYWATVILERLLITRLFIRIAADQILARHLVLIIEYEIVNGHISVNVRVISDWNVVKGNLNSKMIVKISDDEFIYFLLARI
jgi:hypothetical protein